VRIESIDLIRFGHFLNREIDLPPREPDFYLIYGDNEAGKSTLLRGISALFFGVPARTPDVHSCKGSELRIGATISEGEKKLSFRRRKGSSGTVLNMEEAQIQDNVLIPFLRELDCERFEQFFGLDHDRLREGGEELLRGQGDVGSALFQAAGLLDLTRLLAKLDDEAKELFSPRSRSKVIGIALDEYRQARTEVRRLAISAATVKEKQAELDRAKQNHEALKTEAQSLQVDLVKLRRIASNKPDVARLQDLRTALIGFQSIPSLPLTARRQRDDALAALADATSQIDRLNEQMARRKERVQALPLGVAFKTYEKDIQELNAGIHDYIRAVSDRPKRAAEFDEAIQLAEAEWKEVWRKRPVSDAEELRSVYSRKREILALINEHAKLSTSLADAEEMLRTGKEERERLEGELTRSFEPPDPAALIAAVEHAKSLGDTDSAIARLKSDIKRLTADAAREMNGLRLWSGTLQQFETFPAPLLATIEQYAREWDNSHATQKELTLRQSRISDKILEVEGDLRRDDVKIGKAGESDLTEARARRDKLWNLIRSSMFDKTMSDKDAQQQSDSSAPLPESFAQQVRLSDEIADLRFANAKEAALHDRLVKDVASARSEQQSLKDQLAKLQEADVELQRHWSDEWSALGTTPLSPSEMREWMQSRQTVLDRLEQSRERENELHILEERTSAALSQISEHRKEFGTPAKFGDESLAIVIKVSQAVAKEAEEQRRVIREFRRQLESLSLEKRQAKVDDFKTKLSEWSARWNPLVTALLMPDVSTPEQVGEALDVLERVFLHLKDGHSLQHRVKRIGDNVADFESKASELIATLDSSLAELSPQAAIAELHSRCVETGKAETERNTLEAQNGTDEATIAICRVKAQTASTAMAALKQRANCEDNEQLEAVIIAAEQKAAKQEEYDRIAQGLVARNAIPDLKQIEEEASGFELDALTSEIQQREDRERSIDDELFKAGGEYSTLLQEHERLQGSEESAVQAQKAEDALAKVRPAVAQYLRLRLASEVLRRAIESYREKHQGPVLQRASELFSRLTLGEHFGLTTSFGEHDRPVLVAIRKNKEQVEVSGLSDGTRDQLYFALRLAAIEHHIEAVAPCPVILDDVLINSDDTRAAAALDVLSELAKRTQVILFTHHRRLTELGAKACAQVIDFESDHSPVG